MRQNGYMPDTANAISQYFSKAELPTQQETLGEIVVEILSAGRHLNRKSICTKLLSSTGTGFRPGRGEPLSLPDWSAI